MSDEENWDDSSAFYKALPSDVDDAVSLKLLTAVWETNDMWSGQKHSKAGEQTGEVDEELTTGGLNHSSL